MNDKHNEATSMGANSKNKLAKAIFWIVLIVIGFLIFVAALVNFDKFLKVAIPVFVFITAICWTVRTRNIHWYVAEEINMETYIVLYDVTIGETKNGYKRIIENSNERSTTSLMRDAQLSSYTTLYLFSSVAFLFVAEMFILMFYGLNYYLSPSQCDPVWFAGIVASVVSLFFSICACVSLYVHLFISNKEKCRFTKFFEKVSSCFAKKVPFFSEGWKRFYREDEWGQFYYKIFNMGEDDELLKEGEKLRKDYNFKQSATDLDHMIQKYKWLIKMFKYDKESRNDSCRTR